MNVAEIRLTEDGEKKMNHGGWWFGRDEVQTADLEPGAVVDVLDTAGNYRARAFYSSRGPIALRRISRAKVDVDQQFFCDRILQARKRRGPEVRSRRSFRVVHGQADLLPGMVVESYANGRWLVLQLRNQSLDRFKSAVLGALDELFEPDGILLRNDVNARRLEDLDQEVTTAHGEEVPHRVLVREQPYEAVANLREGQKTGTYLDQVPNRARLRCHQPEGRLLDLFCYVGEWGLSALASGTEEVLFVDRSQQALDLVRENLERNGWSDRGTTRKSEAFDYLHQNRDQFDHAVVDPPAFAKDSGDLRDARRGYRDLNFRAMRQIKEGGLLATSSCSSYVDDEEFRGILRQAAEDADVVFRMLEQGGQGADHPWLLDFSTGHYLTCSFGWVSLE